MDDAKQPYEEHVSEHESVEGPVVGRRRTFGQGTRHPGCLGVGHEEGPRRIVAVLAPMRGERPLALVTAFGQTDAVVDEGIHATLRVLRSRNEGVAEEPKTRASGVARCTAWNRDGIRGVPAEPAVRVRKVRLALGLATEGLPNRLGGQLLGSRRDQATAGEVRAEQQGDRENRARAAAGGLSARSSRVMGHRVARG